MSLAEIFIVVFLCFYTKYFFSLFSSMKREEIQKRNQKLDKLRKIPIKSIKKQKEFLNLRYPKKTSTKFEWNRLPNILFIILIYIILFFSYKWLIVRFFDWVGYEVRLWQSILFIILMPLCVNVILKRFDLQQQESMLALLRRG